MRNVSRRNWLAMAGISGMAMAGRAAFGAASDAGTTARQIGAPPLRAFAWNVLDFGASGNGKTDNTAAFQRALDAAHAAEGGIVHVPAGHYVIAGSLHLPPETALVGVSCGPISHANYTSPNGKVNLGRLLPPSSANGSMLLATGGRGKEHGTPLITQGPNTALVGLSIYYPDQKWKSTPIEYPWTIRLKGNNCTVENVELLNSWRGIKAVQAHRHLIRGVTGQPLRVGIFVDEVYDIGRIEDVHFYPWWQHTTEVRGLMYHHGESFVFGRTDWEYVLNTFSIGYYAAYRFMQGKTGSCNGNFVGIGADSCRHACVIEHAQEPGLLITNGEFVSDDPLKLGGADDGPMQVWVKEGTNQGAWNQGPVRFVNCSFWGPSRYIARLDSNTTLGFGDCTFCSWDAGHAAILANAGNLLVSGCEFRQDGKQIHLGPKVQQAVICGNLSAGRGEIVNEAMQGDIQIGLNSGMK